MRKTMFILTIGLILITSNFANALSFLDIEVATERFSFWDIHADQHINDDSVINNFSMSATAISDNSYSYSQASGYPSQINASVPYSSVSATAGWVYDPPYPYASIELSADNEINPYSEVIYTLSHYGEYEIIEPTHEGQGYVSFTLWSGLDFKFSTTVSDSWARVILTGDFSVDNYDSLVTNYEYPVRTGKFSLEYFLTQDGVTLRQYSGDLFTELLDPNPIEYLDNGYQFNIGVTDAIYFPNLNAGDYPQFSGRYTVSASLFDGPPPVQPVPEPSTMLLLGTGLIGLAASCRKKFKNK